MMVIKSLGLFALVITSTLAQQLTINTPNADWVAGSDATITWSYTPGGGRGEAMKLDLVSGPDSYLVAVASLGSGIDPRSGSLTIKVPSNLDPAGSYAIRATSGNVLRFTARFKIIGGGVVGNPSSTALAAAPSATSKNGSLAKTPCPSDPEPADSPSFGKSKEPNHDANPYEASAASAGFPVSRIAALLALFMPIFLV